MPTTSSEKYLSAENLVLTDLGPCLHEKGVTYRVWALGHQSVSVEIEASDSTRRVFNLEPAKASGYFFGTDFLGMAGDLYKISIDGAPAIPDFVSHCQPQGVMGPSLVVDSEAFSWQVKEWKRPAWDGQVVYECHVGTFTPAGTFRAAIDQLGHLCALGVTALEIMPVAESAGARNWGYDGVMLFAPSHTYGTPDDFRTLIDACHQRGLAVILDVVFNHLGPEGNFSHQYSHSYFHEASDSAWGRNFNLDGPNCEPVRALLRQNIRYWLDEFHIDGFRMDATNAVHDPSPVHLLAEAAQVAHERGAFIIAEDDRNLRKILEPREKGGWNFDAVWADDFHHVVRVGQTHERQAYYSMVQGSVEELVRTLNQGWLYTGQTSPFRHAPRGEPCGDFAPQHFVYCISNHDQVGNRFLGDRLHHVIDPAAYRALSLFLCLVPYTPMLFMGQEWGADSPFLYFTDMTPELGRKITEGRAREFPESDAIKIAGKPVKASDPQEMDTFLRSKLDWTELGRDPHRRLLDLYRAGLKLRRELFGAKNPPRSCWRVEARENGVALHYDLGNRSVSVQLHLGTEGERAAQNSSLLLRSNAAEFAGEPMTDGPETVVVGPERPMREPAF